MSLRRWCAKRLTGSGMLTTEIDRIQRNASWSPFTSLDQHTEHSGLSDVRPQETTNRQAKCLSLELW